MEILLNNLEDNEMFLACYPKAKIPKQCQELFSALKQLAEKGLEINAVNLYYSTKNKDILILFVKLLNKMDRKQLIKEFYEKI